MNFKNICALATLLFITSDTSCAAKKKEIFIPGPTKEFMAQVLFSGPETGLPKHVAERIALNQLTKLYAKEHPLPTLKKAQQHLENRLSDCELETDDSIRFIIARTIARERVDILSPKQLQEYYEKIKSDPKAYVVPTYIFDEGFPPFSVELLDNIRFTLYNTWTEQEEEALKKESLETLKQNPIYLKYIKECKERTATSSRPTLWAFNDLMLKNAKQLVQAMSNGQVKKYYENHSDIAGGDPFSMNDIAWIRGHIAYGIRDDLIRKTLRPIAQKYTFKSDSPEVLAFIEELKSGKDQS